MLLISNVPMLLIYLSSATDAASNYACIMMALPQKPYVRVDVQAWWRQAPSNPQLESSRNACMIQVCASKHMFTKRYTRTHIPSEEDRRRKERLHCQNQVKVRCRNSLVGDSSSSSLVDYPSQRSAVQDAGIISGCQRELDKII